MLHTILLLWAAATAPHGDNGTLTGQVRTPDGTPINGARVTVVEMRRTALTGADGHYTFTGLPRGAYRVTFSAVGFAPQLHDIALTDTSSTLDVTLRPSVVELAPIQVTASPIATDPLTSPQPVSMKAGEDLAASQAPSLGETLQGLAGVHSWSTGVGIGKPVIRGLSSNRVLVLEDGQRMETQQWGDEHSPNVETEGADRVEVIRGPASVLYGSDAIGGVVNVVHPDLPDAIGRAPLLRGSLQASYGTNNQMPDGAATLEGANGGFGYRLSGTARKSDDVQTPHYALWNSGNQAASGSGTIGYRGGWGSLSGSFSHRAEHIELTDEDSTATPNQRIGTDVGRVDLVRPLGNARLEASAGYERSRRREFEDAADTLVSLGLLQNTVTTDIRFHHAPLGQWAGILGFSGMHTSFDKFGEETLIPDSRSDNAGVYVFEQTQRGPWGLSAGLRYDYRKLDVDPDSAIGVAGQTRNYNAVTGNFGLLYRIAEPVALVLNVGRGFRAPSSFDLFSDGVHEGTTAFEKGNPTLKNETSLNTDLALRVQTDRVALEVGGFVNAIQDYIYTIPTGTIDSASGFQIFDVTQGDARLAGLELGLEYHPIRTIHLAATGDYVHGQNTTTGNPLPNMPPVRFTWTVRYEPSGIGGFRDPYVQVGGEANGAQTRLDPAEAAFYADAFGGTGYRSTSYHLMSAGAGLTFGAVNRPIHASVSVKNVTNVAYAEFLSRIKTNAVDPGMGRSVILRVAADF